MKKLITLALLLIFSAPLRAQSVDDLVFITEDYPPLNFEREGKRQGISVDALVEMLKLAGAAKGREDIKVWPWARGYDMALKEKNIVLFATTRTETREKLFKWVGPLMPSRIVLVAKKERAIKLRSAQDINNSPYRIGVVREDIGEQLLAKLGVKKERTYQANSGVNLAKMLEANRIDLWAYGSTVILWNMKELGYRSQDYEEVYTLTESQQYYAVSNDTDDKVVASLQRALDQLKANGKLDEIIARYR